MRLVYGVMMKPSYLLAPRGARRRATLSLMAVLPLAACDVLETGYVEVLEVTVGPTLAKCYGAGVQRCMVVDGKFFYDGIEGFEYEAGYDHRLRIGKHDPWGGDPPQDAGRYAYRLLERLGSTPAPSTPATLKVGPARVVCARTDDFCPVLDGEPYEDLITDFDYEPGDHYVLEARLFEDGRYLSSGIVSRTVAEGTGEEIVALEGGRVECGDGHSGYCKLVDGVPFRGEIVGFDPRHEDGYRLRVERFEMFPDGEGRSALVPPIGYRWLETVEHLPGG